jgi:hypothetical protein
MLSKCTYINSNNTTHGDTVTRWQRKRDWDRGLRAVCETTGGGAWQTRCEKSRDVTSTLYLECYTCKNETVQVGYTNTHAETETDLAFKHLWYIQYGTTACLVGRGWSNLPLSANIWSHFPAHKRIRYGRGLTVHTQIETNVFVD